MRTSTWYFDRKFNIIIISWLELKASTFCAIPALNHSKPDQFEIFWIHTIAFYYFIDSSMLNGNKILKTNMIFPKLRNVSENTVSKDSTQVIR